MFTIPALLYSIKQICKGQMINIGRKEVNTRGAKVPWRKSYNRCRTDYVFMPRPVDKIKFHGLADQENDLS
jgi:hypothetical protein